MQGDKQTNNKIDTMITKIKKIFIKAKELYGKYKNINFIRSKGRIPRACPWISSAPGMNNSLAVKGCYRV